MKTPDTLDTELLLAHVLRKDRAWLLAHPDTPLSEAQKKEFASLCERRRKHEPIAYILGEKEFYGRPFFVDQRVLIPRPSTEGLIDLTLDFLKHPHDEMREVDTDIVVCSHFFKKTNNAQLETDNFSIIDVGTGSGCIAITLALELPGTPIIATDISAAALEVAKKNAKRHNVSDRITFMQTSLIPSNLHKPSQTCTNLSTPFLIVSNPPYIPESETLMDDVALYEPHEALFAGSEGMDVLAPLFKSAQNHPQCMGIILECRQPYREVEILSSAMPSQKK